MSDEGKSAGPGEKFELDMQVGKTTIFRYNRPVRYRLELTNGTLIEGVIPANSEFRVNLQVGDIHKFDVIIEDSPTSPIVVK
ncbi:TPA: hypothetical protein ACXE8V_001061 [Pluralibacter gergoviae]